MIIKVNSTFRKKEREKEKEKKCFKQTHNHTQK